MIQNECATPRATCRFPFQYTVATCILALVCDHLSSNCRTNDISGDSMKRSVNQNLYHEYSPSVLHGRSCCSKIRLQSGASRIIMGKRLNGSLIIIIAAESRSKKLQEPNIQLHYGKLLQLLSRTGNMLHTPNGRLSPWVHFTPSFCCQ